MREPFPNPLQIIPPPAMQKSSVFGNLVALTKMAILYNIVNAKNQTKWLFCLVRNFYFFIIYIFFHFSIKNLLFFKIICKIISFTNKNPHLIQCQMGYKCIYLTRSIVSSTGYPFPPMMFQYFISLSFTLFHHDSLVMQVGL